MSDVIERAQAWLRAADEKNINITDDLVARIKAAEARIKELEAELREARLGHGKDYPEG